MTAADSAAPASPGRDDAQDGGADDPFRLARQLMVDGQIRPNKVNDPRILDAMRRLPRERFVPPALRSRAYADEDVPLGSGRVLMEPMVIARLIQALAPQAGERVLVVGAGVGYGAAILAGCGARVIALEQDERLLALARTVLAELAPAVQCVSGLLAAGWAAGAPYEGILIEGAVGSIPASLDAQLARETGRVAAVMGEGRLGVAALAAASPAGLRPVALFDCATPMLPELVERQGFRF